MKFIMCTESFAPGPGTVRAQVLEMSLETKNIASVEMNLGSVAGRNCKKSYSHGRDADDDGGADDSLVPKLFSRAAPACNASL